VKLPESKCPTCGYVMDSATCIEKKAYRPKPGDLSICLKCGEILIFKADLRADLPDVADLLNMPKETEELLMRAQRTIREQRLIK
jgi:hypothetical protein